MSNKRLIISNITHFRSCNGLFLCSSGYEKKKKEFLNMYVSVDNERQIK